MSLEIYNTTVAEGLVADKTGKIENYTQTTSRPIFNEASVWPYCTVNKLYFDMPEGFSIKLIVEIHHFEICGSL